LTGSDRDPKYEPGRQDWTRQEGTGMERLIDRLGDLLEDLADRVLPRPDPVPIPVRKETTPRRRN